MTVRKSRCDLVFCHLPSGSPYTKHVAIEREGERERIPLIHLASLCCCLGPMVTSEIEDEHERELQRSPFADSKKSAPNYSESKYQLKQAASPFSPLSRVHDFLRKQGQKRDGMRTSSHLSPPPTDRTWHLC